MSLLVLAVVDPLHVDVWVQRVVLVLQPALAAFELVRGGSEAGRVVAGVALGLAEHPRVAHVPARRLGLVRDTALGALAWRLRLMVDAPGDFK